MKWTAKLDLKQKKNNIIKSIDRDQSFNVRKVLQNLITFALANSDL